MEQARPTNVSDVPRSFQSWVSTIQSFILTDDVFLTFFLKNSLHKRFLLRGTTIYIVWTTAPYNQNRKRINSNECAVEKKKSFSKYHQEVVANIQQ